jgi:diacylglycerol kinase family enzyme
VKKQMIQALKNHAIANIHLHKTNIDIYFTNPAGIGEHSDILEAVQGELDKIALHEDRLAILRNWPEGDDNAEKVDGTTN